MSWTQWCIIGIFLYLSLPLLATMFIFVLPTPIPGNIPGKVTFLVTFGIRISKVLGIKKFSAIYYQNFHLSLNPKLAL